MQTQNVRFIISLTLVIAAANLAGCCCTKKAHAPKEVRVTLPELSAPARATVQKVTAGGKIEQMTKEVERGRTVYDVEATVGGRHLEYLVAESDGEVLGIEVPIAFADLPDAVRNAAEQYFGASTGLTAMKGVEYGETSYEIVGKHNGKTEEVTFDPAGKRQ